MTYQALVADDYEDMRELLEFVFNGQLGFDVDIVASGNEAIKKLKNKSTYDIIVTDLNMPDGTGLDLYKFYKASNFKVPFFVISGDLQSQHPELEGPNVTWLKKPFDIKKLVSNVQNHFTQFKAPEKYFAVSLQTLQKIRRIESPLFVKINEQKYVQISRDTFEFTESEVAKYQQRNLLVFYLQTSQLQNFLSIYRKSVASSEIWRDAEDNHHQISVDTELLKSIAEIIGWGTEAESLVKESIERALSIVSHDPHFAKIIEKFKKNEKYGVAEHCSLSLFVCSHLLKIMGINDKSLIMQLTYASILHDITLEDETYASKAHILKKDIRQIQGRKNVQQIFEHPIQASSMCNNWDFCPPQAKEIILNHHEKPDGSGFPFGKKASDLDFLSSLFIVAEDFANFCIYSDINKSNYSEYIDSKKNYFSVGHFESIFRALTSAIKMMPKKAQE